MMVGPQIWRGHDSIPTGWPFPLLHKSMSSVAASTITHRIRCFVQMEGYFTQLQC